MLTDKQHEARSQGVGASEVAALWGIHPYFTEYQLWAVKTHHMEKPDLSDNDFVWWGNQMEEPIAQWYMKETASELIVPHGTYYCPTEKRLLCHPDRIVLGQPRLVEIKTAQYNPDKWGLESSDECPLEYVLQCQAQMACAPAITSVDLVVMFRNVFKCQIYNIKRDNDLIKKIIHKVHNFWYCNVESKIAPALQNLDDVKMYYPTNIMDECIEADQTILSSLEVLEEAKKLEKDLKRTKETHQKIICEKIGQHSGVKHEEYILATWKADKNGKRTLRVK